MRNSGNGGPMAVSEVERVLELTAREICKGVEAEFNRQIKESIGPDEWPDANYYDFSVVLKRRLLPLLLAGERAVENCPVDAVAAAWITAKNEALK